MESAFFQLQTIHSSDLAEGLVFFGPLVGLLLVARLMATYRNLPCRKDPIFGWPMKDPFGGRLHRIIMALADRTGLIPIASSSFAYYGEYRTNMFAEGHLASPTAQVQPGPQVEASADLSADGLEQHLQKYDVQCGNTSQDTWHRSQANVDNFTIGNEASLEERLQLIAKAKSAVWIITWCFEDSNSGNLLAEALIAKARAGVDVRVIVDACNLYYLFHKEKLTGKNQETKVLHKLVQGGIKVRMLDTWFEEKKPSYVCGSHRKMMLVDDSYLLTGGRNISDEYLASDTFHFKDMDVTLQSSSFGTSTRSLYESLWGKSRHVNHLTQAIHSTATKAKSKQLSGDDGDEIEPTESESIDLDSSTETCSVVAVSLGGPSLNLDQSTTTSIQQNSPLDSTTPIYVDREVALFQLDHKAGNPKGEDIIFSTLLYLIETAKEKIDLVHVYFQLLPGLEEAIAGANARGVRIRLITNSGETTDLRFFNKLFGQAVRRMLELGVEVYIPTSKNSADKLNYCIHYKMAMIDSKVVMMGSWNCIGISVFHDDEFSVVMFDQADKDQHNRSLGDTAYQPFEDALQDGFVTRIESLSEDDFGVALHYQVLASKAAKRQMERGF
ncbi:Phospholipase D [Seminavis robusta]|uniref:Phospholipase D n=1 Tax=Seminavis robusta TaxID=568900 RepID=A0A9N8DUK8_9STRA|nr:Phospholipase D [Seminavis robusta]|eukprot:Sro259_g101400.1 Phospholipase D (612) ;mRNA; f:51789-53624